MKKQTRNGMFETNSSSVHTLVVPKSGGELKIPEVPMNVLKFGFAEDGTPLTRAIFDDTVEGECMWRRLAVLYELCSTGYYGGGVTEFMKRRKFIRDAFKKLGFECEFNEDPEYVGHVEAMREGNLYKFESKLFEDESMLVNFAFSDKSSLYEDDRNWAYEHGDEIESEAAADECDVYISWDD